MIPIIAWRNIWRSKTRSWVVIGAIAVGIWAAIFLSSFASGMIKSYVDNAIETSIAHIQIHNINFPADRDVAFVLENVESRLNKITQLEHVKAATVRSLAEGSIAAASGMRGARIMAVDPETEAQVSRISQKMAEGSFFENSGRNPILISTRLAELMNLKMRSKVVLTFQNLNEEITAASFRIAGLYDTGNNPFDEFHVLILREDMNRIMTDDFQIGFPGDSSAINGDFGHEIAIFLDDQDFLDSSALRVKALFPSDTIRTYRQISPDLELYEAQIQNSALIYMAIIMLALIFGIINTMLMAVLERYHELGMLMAIGMNKIRVFFMIVFETFMLCMIAVPIGLGLGLVTTLILGKHGINLTMFSKGLRQFGMNPIIYPDLMQHVYIQLVIAVALTAILASIYPALKAIRLRPVEAIRKL